MMNSNFEEYRDNIKKIFKESELLQAPKVDEYKSPLHEMATITPKKSGFGFIVTINSDDHTPKHMHFFNYEKKPLFRVEITDKIPTKREDIVFLENIPRVNSLLDMILTWANTENKYKVKYWVVAQMEWENLHPED